VADKQRVLETAARLGLAVPGQHVVRSAAQVDELIEDELEFPVVLKPFRSVAGNGERKVKLSVRHAADASQLRDRLRDLPAEAFPVLLQRRIEGPGIGVFVLIWNGELKACCAHRRIREKPPSGGVSVYRASVPVDAMLLDQSCRLLNELGWSGVAMVEFKLDAASGRAYLMEINGRFWGSLQLAVDAGVDFPSLLLRHAHGEAVAPVTEYATGIRSRWWWGEVDHLIARWRRSREALDLPADGPGRMRVLRDFLTVRPGVDRNEILQRDDPRPFLRESIDWCMRR
jgi:predicted ATP-grasp superfamily ATP-dependent carboligase